MKKTVALTLGTALAVGSVSFGLSENVYAGGFNPMNMMNPSKWFGSNDRNRDNYYGPEYGYYGAPGYGAPPAYGQAYPPPTGYGYGYGGVAPQQGYSAPAPAAGNDQSAKIQKLEDRIRQLEASKSSPPPAAATPPTGYQGQDSYNDYPPFNPDPAQ